MKEENTPLINYEQTYFDMDYQKELILVEDITNEEEELDRTLKSLDGGEDETILRATLVNLK